MVYVKASLIDLARATQHCGSTLCIHGMLCQGEGSMTTKELVKAEIDNIPEADLDELYQMIQGFMQSKVTDEEKGLMARLRRIRIDAPEDFAANFDQHFVQAGFQILMS